MKIRYITLITVLLILTFALPLSAQKRVPGSLSSFAEDTSIFPHDFNDEYYAENGVFAPSIIHRRDGNDFLSVFGLSSNPTHRNIRVLAALPAYNENGEPRFWSPLGELIDKSFTNDGAGVEAREMAALYPIYVFPKLSDTSLASFANTRQAALIDELRNGFYYKGNPLGLRMILLVNFSEKAFNTKEGMLMMEFMEKKNGLSLDGTPLIKNREEITELLRDEFITVQKQSPLWDDPPVGGLYAISPVINIYANKGVIAPDAFLIMATRNGQPLPGESIFVHEFGCLQKFGTPCESNQ
jgi:hypothetical protein